MQQEVKDVEQALSPRSTTSSPRIPAGHAEEQEALDAAPLQDVKASCYVSPQPPHIYAAVYCVEGWALHACPVLQLQFNHKPPVLCCDTCGVV